MIPKLLKLRGIYSYREEQVIDFTKLTDAGLFGIFGDVGSGKSTILEAIIFCIYGKSERLKQSGENRNYNMMNLMMQESEIDFTFTAGPDQQEYNIYYKFGRNKNHFDDVSIRTEQYYKVENGKKIPVEHEVILEDVGLTYENFKMTVIIPQGKFRDFIELSNAERSKMLKELFRLHQFDLSAKVKILETQNDSLLDQKSGEISAYQFEDESKINEREKKLSELIHDLKSLTQELAIQEKNFQEGQELKNYIKDLLQFQTNLEVLSKDTVAIQQLENDLKEYVLIRDEFKDHYREEITLQKNLKISVEKKSEFQDQLGLMEKEIESHSQDLKKYAIQFNEVEALRSKAEEFEKMAAFLERKNEESNAKKELSDIQHKLESIKKSIQGEQDQKSLLDGHIKVLKNSQLPEHVILEVKQWFLEKDNAERIISDLQKNIDDLKIKQLKYDVDFKNLIVGIDGLEKYTHLQEIDQLFEKRKLKLQEDLNLLQEEKTSLSIKMELSRHAGHLEDGKPCILCGSVHHPAPLQSIVSDMDVTSIDKKIKELNQKISEDLDRGNKI
ncbi:MAG: AAA family ATPase, partial [Chitinophagaceae bacterium]